MSTELAEVSWDAIRRSVADGVPIDYRRTGQPPVDFLVEAGGAALVLRVPLGTQAASLPRPRQSISARVAIIGSDRYLEARCDDNAQFRDFHALMTVTAERIQRDGINPCEALEETIENWERLVQPEGVLSEEEQIGLWGELWLLDWLSKLMPAPLAVSAWVGPAGEPHDFRLGVHEVEVKTTRRLRRQHTIHGLAQLEPSEGCTLALLSLQIEPTDAESGITLEQAIATLRATAADAQVTPEVEKRLADLRYRDRHSGQYREPYRLRSEAVVCPVGSEFPRIVRADVLDLLGPLAERVGNVRYEADVTNLPGSESLVPAHLGISA